MDTHGPQSGCQLRPVSRRRLRRRRLRAQIGRFDDESLGLTPEHVLVMRNIGPVAAGMPEAGSIPIPKYLARQGVRDMVRISDGRMSGTAYGTIVLHVSPEAALGGPLALVRNGDRIRLDVTNRTELVGLLGDDLRNDRNGDQ